MLSRWSDSAADTSRSSQFRSMASTTTEATINGHLRSRRSERDTGAPSLVHRISDSNPTHLPEASDTMGW